MLLFAEKLALFKETDLEPTWVEEWISKRTEKIVAKIEKENAPIDEVTEAKRAKEREKRETKRQDTVSEGAAELELWLRDLLRAGLLSLPEKGSAFFDKTAARMVDAKATGLANRVRDFNEIQFYVGNEWQSKALAHISSTYLLLEGLKNIENLPNKVQEDIRNLIGWSLKKEDILQRQDTEIVKDNWWVISKTQQLEPGDINVHKFWLFGTISRRFALITDFSYKGMPIQTLLAPSTFTHSTLAFFPSNTPLRAIIKEQGDTSNMQTDLEPIHQTWRAVHQDLAQRIAQNPWISETPLFVGNLYLIPLQNKWFLRDAEGSNMEIKNNSNDFLWELMAELGGKLANYFLIYSGENVMIMKRIF
jgi:hypothetical protein